MNSGTSSPKLRSLPPSKSAAEALAKLDKLSDWTQKPAQDAAAAIGAGEGAAAAPAAPETPAATPEAPEAKPVAQVAALPWDSTDLGVTEAVKSVNFKLPMPLYLKLKWLGDTTYGSSMTQLVITAMEKATDELLRERGITPRP